jgi:hypothetical protein
MSGLKKWIRGKTDSTARTPSHGAKDAAKVRMKPVDIEASFPFLPESRQPIGASTPQSGNGGVAHTMANYGLFQLLPVELRHQILIDAFGGRTVHMDLSHDFALVRRPQPMSESSSGGGSDVIRNHCDLVRDVKAGPRAWRWFGCVCHRAGRWPPSEAAERGESAVTPTHDVCVENVSDSDSSPACDCDAWSGKMPDKCFIGAMGWLLACRQA